MALEARTLILLIDFKGHPILADELTNNLRYNYLNLLIITNNTLLKLYYLLRIN